MYAQVLQIDLDSGFYYRSRKVRGMGFWNWFSQKKNKNRGKKKEEAVQSDNIREQNRSVRLNTQTERINYIKDNCEIILESGLQIGEAKQEYQAVTSYLTDMQKMDLIPKDQKDTIEDAATRILNLTKERSKLQKASIILSDRHYRLLERYELQIPKELPMIMEKENYQVLIEQDIAHLEQERDALEEEQEEIISKQSFLKGIAIATSIVVLLLFLLFALLSAYSESEFTIPFLLTVLMGMASAIYIFSEARRNASSIRMVQMKQNRQIMLMNKVKIKSVNNRSYLDYTYNKYMVENYKELKKAWEEYIRLKDEARRYQNNTELLEFYNNTLIHELKMYQIADSEIWIYQPSAILDSREMVEVRHRLNIRRQKLRDRMDENEKQKEEALEAIQGTIKTYPDVVEEAGRILRNYKIQID